MILSSRFRETYDAKDLEAKWSAHLAGQDSRRAWAGVAFGGRIGHYTTLLWMRQTRERRPRWQTLFFYCVIIRPVFQFGLRARPVKHTKRGPFGKNSKISLESRSQPTNGISLQCGFTTRAVGQWRRGLRQKIWEDITLLPNFCIRQVCPSTVVAVLRSMSAKSSEVMACPTRRHPDAGEQLRDAVLDSLQPINVPTLKRALRGPAGPRICEVALSVVLTGDFTGINPRLGQELERVFEHAGRGTLRRSAHQPFLRLGEDFGSLEIVGPRQDTGMVTAGGLTWLADGRRFPTPQTEEFVLKVTDRPRVVVELSGLILGALPPRTFVLRLDDLAEPFLFFDERTRRQRRVGGPIPAGRYWLLHRATDTLVGAEQRYEWPDGERALSLFQIRPGAEVKLESGSGGPWPFAAALLPFFDAVGERLAHEAGEPIYFGWAELPFIWLPAEANEEECISPWCLNLRDGEARAHLDTDQHHS